MAAKATKTSTEVATISNADLQALLDQQDAALDAAGGDIQASIIKIAQKTTAEVESGDAEPGEFINRDTGENYGSEIEVIVTSFQTGRQASSSDGKFYRFVSNDDPANHIIPDNWKELVGEEFVGERFADYPDAEETYKERVNSGEIKWEKGPQISTTYDYTVLVLPEDGQPSVGRISFLRSTKKAHDKLRQLKKSVLRGKMFWEASFTLSTTMREFGRYTSAVVEVKKNRDTTPEEQLRATEVAVASLSGRVTDNSDQADRAPAPVADTDGMEL